MLKLSPLGVEILPLGLGKVAWQVTLLQVLPSNHLRGKHFRCWAGLMGRVATQPAFVESKKEDQLHPSQSYSC